MVKCREAITRFSTDGEVALAPLMVETLSENDGMPTFEISEPTPGGARNRPVATSAASNAFESGSNTVQFVHPLAPQAIAQRELSVLPSPANHAAVSAAQAPHPTASPQAAVASPCLLARAPPLDDKALLPMAAEPLSPRTVYARV